MNDQGTIVAAEAPARDEWRTELSETIKLAIPIALTQLGQITMMTIDLALIGRLGDSAVAAAALAHTILFTAFVFGLGLVTAVTPLASQAVGARQPRMVRRALRVGLWVDGLAWCLVPAWWFISLRNFMSALDRPQPALWITLGAIPANALLAYALIHGAFGLPKLDILGAGVATSLINLGMCVAAVAIAYGRRPFKKYHVLGHFWRADWPLMGKLLVIGLPISLAFMLEHGLFGAAALLMGWIGTTALAAHQSALQIAAIVFMVPLGIGMAATVRVGHAVGRRDAAAARRAGFAAIALGAVFMAAMAALVVATRHDIPLLFLGSNSAVTAAIAATLLSMAASFFIADGLQTIANGALRGLNDTRIPFLFSAASFWLVGFVSAYVFAFPLGFGAVGIWAGLALGLAVYATLLVARFHILTRRGYLPALVTPQAA
jgi:multidrug resistance protein, MATE family